jgi:hypothetical protein
MTTRHEQIVEILLRQILDEIRRSRLDLESLEEDVEELAPEPAAVSATLVITPN